MLFFVSALKLFRLLCYSNNYSKLLIIGEYIAHVETRAGSPPGLRGARRPSLAGLEVNRFRKTDMTKTSVSMARRIDKVPENNFRGYRLVDIDRSELVDS